MQGHLHLGIAKGDDGISFVREQSFRAPMHLSKPYWDGHILIVNAVNPTAGVFPADHIECRVRVEPGACALFTAPSATRIHRSTGGTSRLEQTFSVEKNAWLEVFPETLIPQEGAKCYVRTRIDVAPGGALIFVESLAPGRVASNEVFAFEQVEWDTELSIGGAVLLRERYRLKPGDGSLAALQTLHAHSYYAGIYAVLPCNTDDLREPVSKLPGVTAGATRRAKDVWMIKVLAPNSVVMRTALSDLRGILYASAGRPLPGFRRQ